MWGEEADLAFYKIKEAFCSTLVLLRPNIEKLFYLYKDSSDYDVGAMLYQQNEKGEDQPVGFFSKKLLPAKCNHDVFNKELTAMLYALRHWRRYLQ